MIRFHLLVLAGTLFVLGCGSGSYDKPHAGGAPTVNGSNAKASEEIDFGALENSVYTNKYFGMSVKLPADWQVQDRETQKKFLQMGVKMMSNDPNLNAAMKASELRTVNMFMVFQYPVGRRSSITRTLLPLPSESAKFRA